MLTSTPHLIAFAECKSAPTTSALTWSILATILVALALVFGWAALKVASADIDAEPKRILMVFTRLLAVTMCVGAVVSIAGATGILDLGCPT